MLKHQSDPKNPNVVIVVTQPVNENAICEMINHFSFRFASITLIEKHLLKSPVLVDTMGHNYSFVEKILVQQKQNKVFDDSLDYRDDEQHVQLMQVDTNVSLLVVELLMMYFDLVG